MYGCMVVLIANARETDHYCRIYHVCCLCVFVCVFVYFCLSLSLSLSLSVCVCVCVCVSIYFIFVILGDADVFDGKWSSQRSWITLEFHSFDGVGCLSLFPNVIETQL